MRENVCDDDYITAQEYNNKRSRVIARSLIKFFYGITRLGRWYSKKLCKLRLYTIYADGRCHWCGVKHLIKEQSK